MKKNLIKTACSLGGILLIQGALAEDKPNVIIIYTDDQGTLDLNCYGASDLLTPNIDALAAEGVRFTQFYAAPVSSVSRANLLSGQFSKRAGVTTNVAGKGLPLEKETLAERMKDNGYATALIGKWHLGDEAEYSPNRRGFDYFWGFRGGCVDNYSHFFYWGGPNKHDLWENEQEIFSYGDFFTEKSLQQMKSFIENNNQAKPFFVYWAVNIPHYPLQGHPKWLEYYSNLENPRRMYAAFLSTLDDYVGDLRSYLEKNNLLENTIIVFQSDNGHSMETRTFGGGGYCGDYRAAKFSLFEGGIRVPAIIRYPAKLPQNTVRDQLAMNIDWFPTIVDLCGISSENMQVDGKSLVSVMVENVETPHDVLHFDFGNQWAVRSGDWKLIHKAVDVKPNSSTLIDADYFLANIKMDRTESKNLSSEYPEIQQELLKKRNEYLNSLNQTTN